MKKYFIISSILLTLIAFIIYISYNISKNTENEVVSEFEIQQRFAADDIAEEISNYFNSISILLDQIAQYNEKPISKEFAEIFSINNLTHFGNAINKEHANYYDSNGNSSLTNKDNNSIKALPKEILSRIEEQHSYYIKLIGNQQLNLDKKPPDQFMDVYFPVYKKDKSGKEILTGIISLEFNVNKIFDSKELSGKLRKDNDQLWVLDEKGNLIYHSNHPEMESRNIYQIKEECKKCHLNFDYASQIMINKEGGFSYTLKDRSQKIAAFSTVSFNNASWKFVISTPSNDVVNFIKRTWVKTLLLMTSILLILSMLSWIVLRIYRFRIRTSEELKSHVEKKALHDKVLESEKKYKELFENNPVPMWVYDLDTLKFLMVNNAAVQHYGYSRDEFLSMTLKDIGPKEEIPKLEENLALPELEIEISSGWRNKKKDGTIINVEITSHSLPVENGIRSRLVMAKDVTEQYRLNKELRESKEQYQSFFEEDLSGDYVATPDGKIINCNPSYLKMFGFDSFEEAKNFDSRKLFMSQDYLDGAIIRLKEKKKFVNFELEMKSKDDKRIFTIQNIIGKFNNAGNLIEIKGYVIDNTERRKTVDALKASEEKFRNLFEGSLAVFLIINPETGKIIEANDAACKYYGWDKQVMIDEKYVTQINTLTEEETKAEMQNALNEKRNYFNFRHRLRNGEIRDVEVFSGPILYAGRKFLYSIIYDVTEKKSAEKEIKLLAHALESVQESVSITDLNDNFLYVNKSFCKTFDYSKEELIGKNVSFVRPDAYKPEVFQNLLINTIKGGWHGEIPNKRKNGEIFPVYLTTAPIKDEKGNVSSLIGISTDITELKRQQAAILENQYLLSEAQRTTNLGIWTRDYVKDNFIWSENLLEILGAKIEENNQSMDKFLTLVHPEDRKQVVDWIQSVVTEKKHGEIDFKVITSADEINFIYSTAEAFFDDEGKLMRIIGTAQNVTERKRAEEELRVREAYLSAIIENQPGLIWLKDTKKRFLAVNNAFAVSCGLKTTDIVDKTDLDIWPRELAEKYQADDDYVMQTAKSISVEELIDEKGEAKWFETFKTPVKDENGRIMGTTGYSHDITERKAATEKIKFLAQALESVNECVTITDLNHNLTYINDAFCKVYGYSKQELIGEPISKVLVDADINETEKEILNHTIKGGWRGELINRKKNGEEFPIYLSTSNVLDEKGNVIALLGVTSDITEQKRVEESLTLAKEKAEEMNRLKSNFLANMSHELRTPMIGVLGFSDLLRDQLENPEQKEMVETIHSSGSRLMQTLNQLLNLSRIEANKVDIKLKEIDLGSFVLKSVKLFEGTAKNKNLFIKAIIKSSFIIALLDEQLLDHILNNLINNAIKFTETGSVAVEVDAQIIDNKLWAIISVIDTGIGIPKDSFEIIFEEFRQASEGLNRSHEGTGLGLTLTKKYVQLLNGEIFVESTVGIGSKFTVRFPSIYKPEMNAADRGTKEIHALDRESLTMPKRQNTKPTILLVENDETSMHFVRLILRNICEIHFVESGEEAIKLCSEIKYDLILMDINLGRGISGIQATQEIRKIKGCRKIPIVAVTAYAMEGDKEKFLEAGLTHYLSKPYDTQQLKKLVKNILNI